MLSAAISRKLQTNQSLSIDSQYIDDNGFLINKNVPIARSGIFIYKRGEFGLSANENPNEEIVVLRVREEYTPELLSKFANLPVTNNHPDDGINPENFKQEVVGTLGDSIYLDGNDVIAERVIIQDKRTIDEILKNEKKELSIGFDAEYEKSEGEFEGRKYSYLEHITGPNHISVVKRGKAGPKYRLNEEKEGEMTLVKRRLFNSEITLNEEDAQKLDEMLAREKQDEDSGIDKKSDFTLEVVHNALMKNHAEAMEKLHEIKNCYPTKNSEEEDKEAKKEKKADDQDKPKENSKEEEMEKESMTNKSKNSAADSLATAFVSDSHKNAVTNSGSDSFERSSDSTYFKSSAFDESSKTSQLYNLQNRR